ncbi:reverse transcriptase [Gossypium australe]|uniref:Reverse transcriptase n=1 Tax=Gossypium australe TaxID=47621 RepID=A0A5B6UZQ1_9ROSI|nr:reverse transcriptase [Gossypium australe]
METKLDQKRMERVQKSCGFSNGIDVEAEGTRGGLCLAWKGEIDVSLKSFSKWHIEAFIEEEGVHKKWQFTGFYRSPYLKEKDLAWDLLRRLSQESNYPWLVTGDFNEIMYGFEKKGGAQRDHKKMEAFRETLEDCQLQDIGYSGTWFTWERGNLLETNIRERLDRGVANEKWLNLFPMGKMQHLPYSMSDHCFILLSWWTLEETTEQIIKDFWELNAESLMTLIKELEILLNQERDDETMARIIDNKIQLNMEIDKDEMYWEQRARANWLQLGDKNSAFFHRCATARK